MVASYKMNFKRTSAQLSKDFNLQGKTSDNENTQAELIRAIILKKIK